MGPKKTEHTEATRWRAFNVMKRLFGLMALFVTLGNLPVVSIKTGGRAIRGLNPSYLDVRAFQV